MSPMSHGTIPTVNTYYYDYFNITSAQMSRDHTLQSPSTYLAGATGTKASYYNCFGGNAYGTDFDDPVIVSDTPVGTSSAVTTKPPVITTRPPVTTSFEWESYWNDDWWGDYSIDNGNNDYWNFSNDYSNWGIDFSDYDYDDYSSYFNDYYYDTGTDGSSDWWSYLDPYWKKSDWTYEGDGLWSIEDPDSGYHQRLSCRLYGNDHLHRRDG